MFRPSHIRASYRAWAWLACAGLFPACVPRPAPDPAPPAADSARAEGAAPAELKSFGLYQWDKDTGYAFGLQRVIRMIGTPPRYSMYFVDLKMGFPSEIVEANAERRIKTIITQELCAYFQPGEGHELDSILAGRRDGYFRRFARAARATRQPLYYRFGYEMNGDWVAWGEEPEKFARAWRRAWRIFREEKAGNVRWVFSPNVVWGGRTVERDIVPYYPGDRYVDVVGVDGYNFGDNHSRSHHWQSFREVFEASLNGLKRHYPRKELWITEVGCADDRRKSGWISEFLDGFASDPALRVFIWFNEDKQYAGEPNWRFDSDEDSLDKFRHWAIYNNSITYFSLPAQDSRGRQARL